jgi:hypothetical protein
MSNVRHLGDAASMTEDDFYRVLYESGFPDWYYELCSTHAPTPSGTAIQKGTRSEVMSYFAEAGQPVEYDGKWRLYSLELENTGSIRCSASLFFQRHGLELTFSAESGETTHGSNLAVLASEAMRRHRPSFTASPPYPRPDHNGDPNQLKAIILEFSSTAKMLCSTFASGA